MKQKKLNDILYVFDITPYVITQDTDADVIKVQQECYEGYVELNPTLADKIVKYNYHMMTITQQEWAPYVDEDDKPSPELAWSSDSATVTIGADDNIFPTLSNPHSVTVTYASDQTGVATIDETTGVITLVADGGTTISASFAGNDDYAAQTVTYVLFVQQAQPLPSPELAWSEESATATIGETNSFPTLTNPYDVTVTYTSSDTEKATIDSSTGEITLLAAGNTTISAVFAGNDDYAAQTVTYALTVQSEAPAQTVTVTAPYRLGIYDEAVTNWITTTQDQSDPTLETGTLTVGNHYSVEQRNGMGQNKSLAFSPSCETGSWGTVGSEFIAPNQDVTITIVQPLQHTGVTVTYNVNNTSQAVPIWYDDQTNAPWEMWVDGIQETVSSTYQFSSTGSHTIQYVFYDHVLDVQFSLQDTTGLSEITGFEVGPDIEEVTAPAWIVTTYDAGASDMIDVEQTYLPTTPPTITGVGESAVGPGATIYVPSASVSDYQSAPAWSDISELIQAIPVQ